MISACPGDKQMKEQTTKIPNLVTEKTLKYSENGKELHKVSNVDELFQELDS